MARGAVGFFLTLSVEFFEFVQ